MYIWYRSEKKCKPQIDLVEFFSKNWRTSVLLVRSLIPLFWTSGDICPGFQSQYGSPRWQALSPVCNGFLRFTSDETPVDLVGGQHGSQAVSIHFLGHMCWWGLSQRSSLPLQARLRSVDFYTIVNNIILTIWTPWFNNVYTLICCYPL